MAEPTTDQTASPARPPWVKKLLIKAAKMIFIGLLLGYGYDWAAPRFYGADRVAGFRVGMLHGALMPVALPSLLLGRDAPIYAPNNSGRLYKIGYIAGINLCGLLVFGTAFRQPRNQ